MQYSEVFKEPSLILPKRNTTQKTFRRYLYDLFDEYLQLISGLEPAELTIPGFKKPISISNIAVIQRDLVAGLKDSIDKYYNGLPSEAYKVFEETLDLRIKKYKHLLNIEQFRGETSFYRIRIRKENYQMGATEMFHIPFELRGKVSTQRFSIPGFPSLYMSKTLYVAWEELQRPNLDDFQAVRLVNKSDIKVLDLTPKAWGKSALNKFAYRYLMTWPLIAACSIKVKHQTDTFKPEYIIPQLLLQWVRATSEIDGIKYNSTHIQHSVLRKEGEFYNVVLPVKEICDEGCCLRLSEIFEMTDTISWQLLEQAVGGQTFVAPLSQTNPINKKIPKLEIIKGLEYPYSFSALGRLEGFMDSLPSKKIS